MTLRSESKLVFLYLLTHPGLTRLGVMRASLPGLAAELKWNLPRFVKALDPLIAQDMILHDQDASFLWVKNFLKYNKPESANVVRSWKHVWPEIPECDLKPRLLQSLSVFIKGFHKGFHEAFKEAIPDAFEQPSPNPELELEPELELDPEENTPQAPAPEREISIPTCKKDVSYPVTDLKIQEWQDSYPDVNVKKQLFKIRQWCIDNQERRKTLRGVPRFVNNWLSREQDKPKTASAPAWYVRKMKTVFGSAYERILGADDATEADIMRVVEMCCSEANLEFREDVFWDLYAGDT